MRKYKSLKEYTNKELIDLININEEIELNRLGAICSEIFRRMNDVRPLLDDEFCSVCKNELVACVC